MAVIKENWKALISPSSISVKESNEGRKAAITVEPLERGYGLTLGNALRRVLLSSLRGHAITSVKISGALHEYSTVQGVKEDVLSIIMNLKSLVIRKESKTPVSMTLYVKGPCVVTADMIKADSGDIMNPDMYICTIEEGGVLDMTMKAENGSGYLAAEHNKSEENEIGVIAVDAVFTPVKRVNYKVSHARVGQKTDYDKLEMDIETNSVITPKEALGAAAKILQEQLNPFVDIDVVEEITEDEQSGNAVVDQNLIKSIDELELSVRSYNCLKNEKIQYVGDLVSKTEAEMLKLSNFGRKSLNELKDVLKEMDLEFGIKLDTWPIENIEEMRKKREKVF